MISHIVIYISDQNSIHVDNKEGKKFFVLKHVWIKAEVFCIQKHFFTKKIY